MVGWLMAAADATGYWRVRGLVQGVGFRWFVSQEAHDLNLRGWVRNLESGDVCVLAEGPAEKLAILKARIVKGPRGSHVESVEDLPSVPDEPAITPFSIIR